MAIDIKYVDQVVVNEITGEYYKEYAVVDIYTNTFPVLLVEPSVENDDWIVRNKAGDTIVVLSLNGAMDCYMEDLGARKTLIFLYESVTQETSHWVSSI